MAILPVALCPLLTDTSILEGQLDEDVWILPPAIPFFVRPRVRWIPEAQTQVFTSYDADAINIAFRCYEDMPERIEREAGPPSPESAWHDDFVGFTLITDDAENAPALRFIMTAAGKIFRERASGILEEDSSIPCQVQVGDTDWCVEARLWFDALKVKRPEANDRWGFAAYRQRVGSRWERSGWLEVGPGPYGENMPGWLLFENAEGIDRQRGRAVEPYLRRFGQLLEVRMHQSAEAQANLPPDACRVTRYRINLMIRSLLSIKNDMLHSFHPDALRHYAQILQFNVGRLDELIENLRQGEDPHTAPDGYVFLGAQLETDGQNHAFALIQGRQYESTMPHPLIIMLDGLSDDWIADSRQFIDLSWPPDLDFLMAVPSGVGVSRQYWLAAEDEIFNVIREVRRRFSVDPRRIVLLGIGPGAEAAYRIGCRFPHVFSALAIGGPVKSPNRMVGSPPLPFYYWSGEQGGWVGPMNEVDERTRASLDTLPVAMPESLRPAFVKRMANTAGAPQSTVNLLAPTARYSRGEWAQIDRPLDYSSPARLTLHVAQDGRVNANLENVGAFSIFPQEGPFVPGQTVRVDQDAKEIISGTYGHTMHCELQPPPKGLLVKTREMAGPLDEAFHGELIYVYGTTAGPESAEMLKKAALQAARWPQYDLRIRVKADAEVTEDDLMQAHLHLFGGAHQNLLVAAMAGRFPAQIKLNAFSIAGETFSDPGFLCQFLYPNPLSPDRYVVVHLSNSDGGWLYRGWFPKAEQSEPLPDLWVARLEDNPNIMKRGVSPVYHRRLWFNAHWQLPK